MEESKWLSVFIIFILPIWSSTTLLSVSYFLGKVQWAKATSNCNLSVSLLKRGVGGEREKERKREREIIVYAE